MKFIERIKKQYKETLPIRRTAIVGPFVFAVGALIPPHVFEKSKGTQKRFWGLIINDFLVGKFITTDIRDEPKVWDP